MNFSPWLKSRDAGLMLPCLDFAQRNQAGCTFAAASFITVASVT
jgi:hypothetical protein